MAEGDKLVNLDGLKAVYDKTNGDITDLKSAVINNKVPITLIANKYIEVAGANAGAESPYNGWSATDFIDLSTVYGFYAEGTISIYNAFYDSEKQFISSFCTLSGKNYYLKPQNAVYCRLSDTTARMSTLALTAVLSADGLAAEIKSEQQKANHYNGFVDLKGTDWGVGYISDSGFVDCAGVNNNNGKRVTQRSISYAEKDIVCDIASGYRYAIKLYAGSTFDTHTADTAWLTGTYAIPAGSYYIIGQIAETTDTTTITNYTENGLYDALTVHYADRSDLITIPERFGDTKSIVCFGNSLTMGSPGSTANPWTKQLNDLLGSRYTVKNHGVGGEGVQTIGGRQGGITMLTASGFTIPATTDAVEITLTNMLGGTPEPLKISETALATPNVNPVHIKGVPGALSYSNDKYYFRRNVEGEAVTVDRPTPIITKSMREERNDILILWTGENGQFDTDYQKLVAYENLIVRYSKNPNYLIISKSNNSYTGEWGTNYRNAMILGHGRKFIDIIEYLVNYGLSDLGITPTEDDEAAIANGVIPPSLKIPGDSTHLTTAAYGIVARLVYERGKELGYWN